ncbi:Minor histocompatibility antigen H13 [Choanephora cucurbitarum]|uniref:Minor histocompatibility antigen H13 n=1 Tax=Choanephora cucurbitarum TaxID=101091 RepID=A0A1C7N2X1_9FUNG|nr:Minor histocompatibility antigen H13 [Choanephora cucurbitarum]
MDFKDSEELGLYIAYGTIITMAVLPIYSGSLASIKGMKRPANAAKAKKSDNPLDDSDDEDESVLESLTSGDAYMFPVIGSCVLFGMYLAFRYLDKEYINYILTIYFSVMGCAAVTKSSLMVAKKVVPQFVLKHVAKYKITLSKRSKNISHISFTVIHGLLMLASVGLTVYYSYTKNWIASNIFGLSFSVNAIQLLSLDSFKTGIILLSGLFFYDIFWVFYTPVMVSVATNFDAPIKLLWPRNIIQFVLDKTAENARFTMLGLGDIVIPGIFVALCFRFDRHMSWKRNPVGQFRSLDFPKPYFTANMIAYVLGLVVTMVVMHFFKAAQPALLYLSPACILAALGTAAARGELKEFFAYTTEEDEDKDKKKKEVEKYTQRAVEQIFVEEGEIEEPVEEGSIEIEEIELDEEEEGEIIEEPQAKSTGSKKNNTQSKKRKNKK